eukprot:9675358-Lingulodinium_polyedra.AAC.1
MRRPPRGGRRMGRAHREMRGAAAVECVPERIPDQFLRESCSETRSEIDSVCVAPRSSQFARTMRQQPCGRRRM